jgi:serine/threonine-protein kinase RsbW
MTKAVEGRRAARGGKNMNAVNCDRPIRVIEEDAKRQALNLSRHIEGFPVTATRDGRVTLTIHTTAGLTAVLDAVVAEMERLGYSDRDVFGVRLALEEALVNALKHGNRSDPNKRVRVSYRVTPEEVCAEVADEGLGFDPDAVADPTDEAGVGRPGGRGLLLMRHYLSSVEFNARGNAVTLRKRCGMENAAPVTAPSKA